MAFTNEYVSSEDLEKYDLIALKDHYLKKDGGCYKEYMKLHWAIDKQKGIWLMYMYGPHLEDPTLGCVDEDFFILHYQDRNIEVILERLYEESSKRLTDDPFRVVWKLLEIKKEEIQGLDYDKVLAVLQDALSSYGWRGIVQQELQDKLLVELKI